MTVKILKANGQVEHHSTYYGLTPEEIASPVLKAEQEIFDSEIEQRLGPAERQVTLLMIWMLLHQNILCMRMMLIV